MARADDSVPTPRSARWPWTRASLSGVIGVLLPFTWVVQLDGCTQTLGRSSTGIDLLREVQLGLPDLALVLALFALVIAGARWAGMIRQAPPRLGLHVLSLIATGALAFRGLSLVFGEQVIRTLQPAGYLVITALVACVVDAVVRVVLGAQECRELVELEHRNAWRSAPDG
jgi:hypothetical protein